MLINLNYLKKILSGQRRLLNALNRFFILFYYIKLILNKSIKKKIIQMLFGYITTLNMTHVSIKYQPFMLIKNIKVPELLLDMFLHTLL